MGVQLGSNRGVVIPFLFCFIVFLPFGFLVYCLFSLLTPLASLDFCENVFLVLTLVNELTSFVHKLVCFD